MKKMVLLVFLALSLFAENFESGLELSTKGEYKSAFKILNPLAKKGHAGAQYTVGHMYAKGQGVAKNEKTALIWYKKAALQGHSEAQYNLGFMYAKGHGVIKNSKESLIWYKKAADQGDVKAQIKLGLLYENEKNYQEALKWYKKAALESLE